MPYSLPITNMVWLTVVVEVPRHPNRQEAHGNARDGRVERRDIVLVGYFADGAQLGLEEIGGKLPEQHVDAHVQADKDGHAQRRGETRSYGRACRRIGDDIWRLALDDCRGCHLSRLVALLSRCQCGWEEKKSTS